MRLRCISLKNYRCVQSASVPVERLTSLVGPNGVGKSTFLRALELFYEQAPKLSTDDFFAGDTTKELTVSLTFDSLRPEASSLFARYLHGTELAVERVFTENGGRVVSHFYGATLRHMPFLPVRQGLEIKDRGKTAKEAYEQLRAQVDYETLPPWTTLSEVPNALSAWEAANPAACVRQRDDGQFFGFSEVAQGYLGRFTRLLYIPAVREASNDALESRGSVLSALMDLVVRSSLTNKSAYQRLQERSQLLYERMMDPTKLSELGDLGQQLSDTLRLYVPDSAVSLSWRPLGKIELPVPTADIKLVEGDYRTSVERTGHGLQRAFIMTMLQQLARARTTIMDADAAEANGATIPNLVLAIEEPELYQHPSRQRHLAKTLVNLATGAIPGVAQSTQVVCATHSPLFLSIERIDELRLLRRVAPAPALPKATHVISTSLEALAETIWRADGQPKPPYSAATLLPRMKPIMTPWINEGFFAEVVVLVEGEDDRAALLGVAQAMGVDLDGNGFAVLPCGGKTCLDRPYAVFSLLGIPTFVMWDGDMGDKEAKPHDNHRLLRLVKQPPVDWPNESGTNYCCFETDLETTMRSEMGAAFYDATLASCQSEFAIPKRKHAQKNATVVARLVEDGMKAGNRCATLEGVITAVAMLR